MRSRIGSKAKIAAGYCTGFAALVLLLMALNFVEHGDVLLGSMITGAREFAGNIHTQTLTGQTRPLSLPSYGWDITFGERGFFSHMPLLLFAIPGLLQTRGPKRFQSRVWAATAALVFVCYWTQSGDYGGWAYGFRYLIPLVPLLFWFAASWVLANRRSAWAKLFYVCLAVGLLTSAVGAYNRWPAVYEGPATRRGAVEENIRSPFAANLLCLACETMPQSLVTRFLVTEVYGEKPTRDYLRLAFTNMKRPDLVARVVPGD